MVTSVLDIMLRHDVFMMQLRARIPIWLRHEVKKSGGNMYSQEQPKRRSREGILRKNQLKPKAAYAGAGPVSMYGEVGKQAKPNRLERFVLGVRISPSLFDFGGRGSQP